MYEINRVPHPGTDNTIIIFHQMKKLTKYLAKCSMPTSLVIFPSNAHVWYRFTYFRSFKQVEPKSGEKQLL